MIQISNIFYDEVTHADNEEQIWWLWSRLRSNAKNTHSIWMSCNPDNSSWVLKYAMWYLYPQGHPLEGRPDPEKNGKIRYLLRINGELCWGDTKEELQEKYGYDKAPISFQGLFGTIDDNPPLQASNPQYRQNLEALPRLSRERLLYGNWFAKPENSSYFSRSTCPTLPKAPLDVEFDKIVRVFDVAGTLPHDGNRSPDYFASVKMGRLKSNGEYVVLEVTRTRITFGQWLDHILDHARRDGFKTEIVLGEDPNPAAKASIKLLARQIIEAGYIAKTQRASQGKLDAFRPFAASAELGIIHIVENCGHDYWNKIVADNEFFLREMENFDGTRKSGEAGHDDVVDCMSLAYMHLVQKFQIPTISFPSMSKSNEFRI